MINSFTYIDPRNLMTNLNDFSVESTIARKAEGVGDMFTYPKDTNPGYLNI